MKTYFAEFSKLSGSLVWLVTLGLPILCTLAGSIKLTSSSDWDTLWIRSIGFYGMAILPVGIAITASLVWRVEHQRGNWAALMSQPISVWNIVCTKATVVGILSALMQITLVISVIIIGKMHIGLSGFLPSQYLLSSVLIACATIPVAALQSMLSMVLSSFALPVAIALVATGLSTAALMIKLPGILLSPYALATFSTQIGTSLVGSKSTVFQAVELSPTIAGLLLVITAVLTLFFISLSSALLNHKDLHV